VLFNSLEFVAFLVVVAGAYPLCPAAWRRWYLLAASYAFYCTWSVRFAAVLLVTTGVAFVLAQRIATAPSEAQRQRYLTAGIVLLLLPLAAFKYLSSLSGVIAEVAGGVPWLSRAVAANFVGAVGISYYTLKLISYLIDVHWERIPPCKDFSALATYAAFFPQILSGPIQRAGSFLSQVATLAPAPPAMVASGLRLMLFGFFKKLVVADRLGVPVDQVFDHPAAFSGLMPVLASYLFALQLYADFSGVTDIAIGTARLFGIESPPNFDAPFYAENIADFWRRWHMTLTSWLGDYVFTPLRMALRDWGQAGLIGSLAINMVAIGVWHGPRWTYVVFGLLHAAYLIGSTLTQRRRKKFLQRHRMLSWLHTFSGPLVTFNMVVASFVFFRAATLGDAFFILAQAGRGIVRAAAGLSHGTLHGLAGKGHLRWSAADVLIVCSGVLIMEAVHVLRHRGALSRIVMIAPSWVRWGAYFALGFAILIWGEGDSKQFIYVRF
jgi:alginate O-acetyltransferase complex protein AlgI